MPRRHSSVLAGIGCVWLAACATLNESECRSTDWFQLGSRDGTAGYGRSRLEDHRKACSEFGLEADDTAWAEGYEAGLEEYCTVDNGYRLGRRGGGYGRVCPAPLEDEFVSAYKLGRETYGVERELDELNQHIAAIESRLSRDKDLSDDGRTALRRQLRDLYHQLGWLRRSHDRLEDEWRRRY